MHTFGSHGFAAQYERHSICNMHFKRAYRGGTVKKFSTSTEVHAKGKLKSWRHERRHVKLTGPSIQVETSRELGRCMERLVSFEKLR